MQIHGFKYSSVSFFNVCSIPKQGKISLYLLGDLAVLQSPFKMRSKSPKLSPTKAINV